jgi:hypothetical protein
MKTQITKLLKYLNKGNRDKVNAAEENIAESIEEAIEEKLFFKIPMNEIVKIIEKSNISNAKLYSSIISRMCCVKGKEAALFLNVVEASGATLKECVQIVSSLTCSQVCVTLGKLYKDNESMVERDYSSEVLELRKEIEELKSQKRTIFEPVTEQPSDFEANIYKAAEEGKLSSIQYLFEQCSTDVKVQNKEEWTPLHFASAYGKTDVVKYLFEQCQVNVEVQNKDGCTPLHLASRYGYIEVVKYLCEHCNANARARTFNEWTPLHFASNNGHIEVVKYLFDKCNADVEAKDVYGQTPLHIASSYGKIKVVRYLIEQCNANFIEETIFGKTPLLIASDKGTKEYLESIISRVDL